MAIIVIKNLFGRKIHASNSNKPLLSWLHGEYIDWMHACGGKGRCTTCKFQIIAGADHFQEPTAAEQRYFTKGELNQNERLACQAVVTGDVVIQVPDEAKLPHIKYTE
jgi:ferredoxin, 2Fe-2S